VEPESKLIVNLTRGNLVCEQAIIADRALRRMRGLLGRKSLPSDEGMLLEPAPSIHTAFMRFPIDVVFLDGTLSVIKIVEQLAPWRATSCGHARAVLELASGESSRRGIELGDRLAVVDITEELEAHSNGSLSSDGAGPTRVLLVSGDRRFRAVAGALLTRRGCAVTVAERIAGVAEQAVKRGAHVVVLDVSGLRAPAVLEAARIESLNPRVGVVMVSDTPASDEGSGGPALAKWEPFDELYRAIERAHPARTRRAASA
jgi:uncharacterized membrane protein (UPF0127 family)